MVIRAIRSSSLKSFSLFFFNRMLKKGLDLGDSRWAGIRQVSGSLGTGTDDEVCSSGCELK